MKGRTYGPRGRAPERASMDYSGLDGVPRFDYDGDKPRANGEELSIIILMYLLYCSARNKSGSVLERRLRRIPGAWQRWRTAVGMLGRAMDAIFATLPGDQCARVNDMANHGQVDIHLPRAADMGGDRMIIGTANFITIMEAALEGTCKLCFLRGAQTRTCALCRALVEEAAPKTWETVSGCVYRDIAMNGIGDMTERTKI